MANVLLIILLIICIILIGLILIQRSEGGALGIGGGGGGGGGLMSGRGTADMVTRMTAILGTAFMLVCLLISISFNYQNRGKTLNSPDAATNEQGLLKSDETTNQDLQSTPDSANAASPLGEDSSTEESSTKSEEEPQE